MEVRRKLLSRVHTKKAGFGFGHLMEHGLRTSFVHVAPCFGKHIRYRNDFGPVHFVPLPQALRYPPRLHWSWQQNVGFSLKADPPLRCGELTKWATTGLLQRRERHYYSITASARIRNDSGIVRPSAFAVLRLITNWNLVGCSTGMSSGLPPRRILITKIALRRNDSDSA
jgi:hypothetical protein